LISAAHRLLNFWNAVCLAIRTPRTKLLWADGTTAATAKMGDLRSLFCLSSKVALLSGCLVCRPFPPPNPWHTELGLGLVKHTIRVRVRVRVRAETVWEGKVSMHVLGGFICQQSSSMCNLILFSFFVIFPFVSCFYLWCCNAPILNYTFDRYNVLNCLTLIHLQTTWKAWRVKNK
jgi:hypothetical protein